MPSQAASRPVAAIAIGAALMLVAGCSGNLAESLSGKISFGGIGNSSTGAGVVPGKSRDVDVRAEMGAPAEIIDEAGGGKLWFYPKRGPNARQTFAVQIGADRLVRSIEQRLTLENVAKLAPGKMTEREVRLLLGPPNTIENWPRLNRNIWDYRMVEGDLSSGVWKVLSAQFSPDGMLREVRFLDDSAIVGNRF